MLSRSELKSLKSEYKAAKKAYDEDDYDESALAALYLKFKAAMKSYKKNKKGTEESVSEENEEESEEKEELFSEELIRKNAKFVLREEIDMNALSLIIDNFKEVFDRMGGRAKAFDEEKGYCVDTTNYRNVLTMLIKLKKSKQKTNDVKYAYGKYARFGRRFHKTPSLQELCKKIRHAICKNIYYDIDIKNAAPTFCYAYVLNNDLNHPILVEYVENREQFLDKIVEAGICPDRDSAKELVLKILNGGGNGKTGFPPLDKFYKDHNEFMKSISKNENFKKYTDKANESHKRMKEKGSSNWDNRLGVALNHWMCDTEDLVICIIENRLQSLNIEYGTLCCDGIHVYKKDISEDKLENLLLTLEKDIYKYTKMNVKLVVKPMDSGVDLTDLAPKPPLNLSDENCAKIVASDLEGEFLYSKLRDTLYLFNNDIALWQPTAFICLKLDIAIIIKNHIIDWEGVSLEEATSVALFKPHKIETDAKQSSILRQLECIIKKRNDDAFILSRFDRCEGYFPISNNEVVNFRTGEKEPRLKTHYFTKTSDRNLLDEYDEKYCNDYYTSLISSPDKVVDGVTVPGIRARDEYRDSLISVFAYILSGDASQKVFVNLIGPLGDNGKSVFLELHTAVMGCFAGPGNRRIFEEQKSKSVHDSEMFGLIGKNMVTLSETSSTSRFNEVVLKAVTGGDATNIRAAASPDSIDVIFSCVPVLATNSMCELVDPVFKNRLLCINFCNTFERDGTFKTKLLDHKDEFFTHLVKYCVQFFKTNTIMICDEIKSFTQVIKDDNYPFRMWVNQCEFVKSNPDESVPREDVLYSYLSYCKQNQYTPLGRTKAYEKISSHYGLTAERRLIRGDRVWVYLGLARSEE